MFLKIIATIVDGIFDTDLSSNFNDDMGDMDDSINNPTTNSKNQWNS